MAIAEVLVKNSGTVTSDVVKCVRGMLVVLRIAESFGGGSRLIGAGIS